MRLEAEQPMNSTRAEFSAPFRSGYRASGVLLHVTSLPSRYGIGDMGPSAFAWVDQLAAAGQGWWQVLPLGPTGYGHSPYQALSSFAANPLVISPDRLNEDGLLAPGDCEDCSFPSDHVDFERVIPFKERLLARAWKNFRSGARADLRAAFEQFCEEKAALQEEPALFMALRAKYRGAPFQEWPAGLAWREPEALAQARRELAEAIDTVPLWPVHPAAALANPQGVRESARGAAAGRSSHLCLPGFVGRVGQSRVVPAGRPIEAPGRRRRSSGLFQCRGPALGQPDL